MLLVALLGGLLGAGCPGPSDESDPHGPARAGMVERQIAARGVKDERVLQVMREVPRHLFVPPDQAAQAYDDHPLPIGSGQTISQPYVVAFMTEQLRLDGHGEGPGDRDRFGLPGRRPLPPRREGLLHRDPARAGGGGDGTAEGDRCDQRPDPHGRRLLRLARGGPVRRASSSRRPPRRSPSRSWRSWRRAGGWSSRSGASTRS